MFGAITTSLPLRATLAAALALLAAATLLVLAIGGQANQALSARTLAELDAEVADLLAAHTDGGLAALERRITARLLQSPGGDGRRLLHLSGQGGRAIAGSFVAGGAVSLDEGTPGPVFSYRAARHGDVRLAAGRVVSLPASRARLLVARDIEDERALARRIQAIAMAGLVTLAMAALAFGLLSRRALLQRVGAIAATAQAVMDGDHTRRIPRDRSGDELDTLAGTLNAMLVRIDELMQSLREVSDNIAHDLKTPVNRLRITAEEALRDGRGPANHREALGAVIEQADGIVSTFNALLLIARLQPGAGHEDLSDTIDLAGLVADVAELYGPVAEDARLSLRLKATPAVTYRGNRQLLGQALANLIDNAIKYSADLAATGVRPIDVALEVRVDTLEITVADCGPGIAADDRPKALQRFGRLDASRSRPGTGLGLSLVAAVARLHGGSLRLEDNRPGLRAVLTLPQKP